MAQISSPPHEVILGMRIGGVLRQTNARLARATQMNDQKLEVVCLGRSLLSIFRPGRGIGKRDSDMVLKQTKLR